MTDRIFCRARVDVVDIEVLDERRRHLDELRVNRRHDARQRPCEKESRDDGRQDIHRQIGHDQVGNLQLRQDRAADGSAKVHPHHDEADGARSDDDRRVHRVRVAIAHAAQGRVRQADRPEADENPERHDKRFRDKIFRPEGRQQRRIDGSNFFHNGPHATARVGDSGDHRDRSEHHDDPLKSVRQRHCTEAADRRVEDDRPGKNRQPPEIGQAGNRLKKSCTADKLRRHRREEKQQQA